MKLNVIVLKGITALVMLVSGVALVISAPNSSPARAEDPINTTWTATGFLNASGHGQGGSPRLGPITIGITKWHTVMTQGGQTIFEEDWTADVPPGDINFSTNNDSTPTIKLPGGYDMNQFKANWLYGAGNTNMRINVPTTFSFSDTPAPERVMTERGRQNMSSIGNTVHCQPADGNSDCIAATGSYGFGTWDLMGDGINNFPTGFGALIPTKWTVTGTFR